MRFACVSNFKKVKKVEQTSMESRVMTLGSRPSEDNRHDSAPREINDG